MAKRAGLFGSGFAGLVPYHSSVDTIGEEFGFTYVSRFWEVAISQLPKIGRSWKANRDILFGSGLAGLGKSPQRDKSEVKPYDELERRGEPRSGKLYGEEST